MFGMKPKTAKEILKLIEALSEDEQEKLYNAFVGEEDGEAAEESKEETPAAEAPETPEAPQAPEQAEAPTETEAPAAEAETPAETPVDAAETPTEGDNAEQAEVPAEAAETPENVPAEGEAAVPEQVPETPADGQVEDGKETYAALAARLNSLEERLAQIEQAQTEALNAEQNADFGLEQTVAPNKAGDNSHYNAVMQGYAGDDAKNYY